MIFHMALFEPNAIDIEDPILYGTPIDGKGWAKQCTGYIQFFHDCITDGADVAFWRGVKRRAILHIEMHRPHLFQPADG